MCDFGISESIMIGLAVASAAASAAAAQQQQAAQQRYLNKTYEQAGQSALENFTQQSGVAGNRMSQNAMQFASAEAQNQSQLNQTIGHAQTAAAESGVGGNSVSALFDSFRSIAAANTDAGQTNLSYANEQLMQDVRSLRSQNQSRINSAIPGPVQQPNYLGYALQAGSSIYNQYDKYASRTQTGMYNPNNYSAFNIPSRQMDNTMSEYGRLTS